ncbi:MAG: S8 family serine peptidase [Candidatus Eremiobacteraeota bacterium]|nr:S8 family serine peptidase [Candidatus Eremiobacteraeota bacterium]
MKRHLQRLATAFAVVSGLLTLVACGGGGGTASTPLAVVPTSPNGSAATGSLPYGAEALAGATYLGAAHLKTVGLTVLVSLHDPNGLLHYAQAANDPHDSNYRHWLSPQQLADRFGASQSDYAAVAKYWTAGGNAVKTYPQRQTLRVRGTQAGVERALGAHFGLYRKGTQTFLALSSAPHLPPSLHVAALGNVVGYRTRSRMFELVRASNAYVQGYSPQQIANAFDYTGAYGAGYRGDGISIGVIGTGPITDGDPRIAGGDVREYRTLFGVGGTGSVVQVYDTANVSPGNTVAGNGYVYSGGLATPPPVTAVNGACAQQGYNPAIGIPPSDYTTCNPEDIEAQIDTEQTASLAPDATVLFYIAYNPNECYGPCGAPGSLAATQQLGITETDDETQQAIADDRADIISMSFGSDEFSAATPQAGVNPGYFGPGTNGFGPVEYASLASEGIAIFASSGDQGAVACGASSPPCVSYPATDPSVVSVGGVNTPLDAAGRLTGPLTGWGLATENGNPSASGGGCSAFFAAPAYESTIASFPCAGKRAQPDASLEADLNTGVAAVIDAAPGLGGRIVEAFGGTSVSAPEMAAMWALVLQACKQKASCATGAGATPYRLGNPNAYFYRIYGNSSLYASTFYDVLTGSNALGGSAGYSAGIGYDLVTGLGVPYGRNLVRAVTGA